MIWGEGASTCMSQGWPELYIYNVHDRIFRDYPAQKTYIHMVLVSPINGVCYTHISAHTFSCLISFQVLCAEACVCINGVSNHISLLHTFSCLISFQGLCAEACVYVLMVCAIHISLLHTFSCLISFQGTPWCRPRRPPQMWGSFRRLCNRGRVL